MLVPAVAETDSFSALLRLPSFFTARACLPRSFSVTVVVRPAFAVPALPATLRPPSVSLTS